MTTLRSLCLLVPATLALAACGADSSGIAPADTGTDVDATGDGGDVSTDTDDDGSDVGADADDDGGDVGGDVGTDPGADGAQRLGEGEICTVDSECASDLCFVFEAGVDGFCTTFCRDASSCTLEGFDCVFLANSGGDFARVCVPEDLCIDADGDRYGVGPGCLGPDCDETSDAINPGADEVCDGVDNDCDEQFDENPVDANLPCSTGFPGVCGEGRNRCVGALLECVIQTEPGTEFCDGLDNDCDGDVDDDTTITGLPCRTDLLGACSIGASTCEAGEVACTPTLLPDAEAESCDGLDNDCDGEIDEDFGGVGGPCFVGEGACRRAGVSACDPLDPAGAPVCNAIEGEPIDELCNYEDDDCDGDVDEDFVNADGAYATDTACGNCFTDCTEVFDRPNAYGVCQAPLAGATCVMLCDDGFFDLNGVPDDGCEFELDGGAIYVSQTEAGAADVDGCGLGPVATGEGRFPCESIAYGVQRAASASRPRVRVADGAYEETVTVVNGVSLLGGHRALTWEFDPATTNTAVRGLAGAGHVRTIIATNVTFPTTIEGFLIYGQNATTAGANSYAVYVRDSTSALTIRNNRIFAGAGAAGASGAPGTNGQPGVNGSAGTNTLTTTCGSVGAVISPGGAGGVRQCQDPATFSPSVPDTFTSTTGGSGGAAVCPAQNRQEGSGTNGANAGGAGGPGGWGHRSFTSGGCNPTGGQPETGTQGGNGSAPTDGGGGGACSSPRGSVVGGEWVAGAGSTGGHAGHGRGGGGGGAGSGQQLNDGNTRDIAGSGGGGGSGGCGGEGGAPGQGGGGSFGIFVVWTTPAADPDAVVQIVGNTIARNRGGDGGQGGSGGAGGDGGAGAAGGRLASYLGPIYCIFPGAAGGFGSRGGHGGGGGGGCGGVSFDIAAWGIGGQPQTWETTNTFALPADNDTAGRGGAGGISNNTGTGIGAAGGTGRFGNIEIRN